MRKIPAFRIRDGKAVPCENHGPSLMVMPDVKVEFSPTKRFTKRERRQEARRGTRGRRGSHRVRPVGFSRFFTATDLLMPERYDGHRLAGDLPGLGLVEALLGGGLLRTGRLLGCA